MPALPSAATYSIDRHRDVTLRTGEDGIETLIAAGSAVMEPPVSINGRLNGGSIVLAVLHIYGIDVGGGALFVDLVALPELGSPSAAAHILIRKSVSAAGQFSFGFDCDAIPPDYRAVACRLVKTSGSESSWCAYACWIRAAVPA